MYKVVDIFIFLLYIFSSTISGSRSSDRHNRSNKHSTSGPIRGPPYQPILENLRMRIVKEEDFMFALYNKNYSKGLVILKEHNYTNVMNYVIPGQPIKFIVHGWKSGYKAGFSHALKDEYLKTGKNQVILAAWQELSNELEYFELIEQTGELSVFLSNVLIPFTKRVGGGNIHILAEGVAAHLCGLAAEMVTRATKEAIARITAFDPSWNSFEIPAYGIKKSHASFVDVIHTSAGTSGIPEPRGHVDFYINGGTAPQPNCNRRFLGTAVGVCSHNLSWGWYMKTINAQKEKDRVGYRCSSWKLFTMYYCSFTNVIRFGERTPTHAIGVYHLKIADWPFPHKDY